jgi:hypothetical protein
MVPLRRLTTALGLVVFVAMAGSAAAAKAPYTSEPSAFRSDPTFVVTYRGGGGWHTTFHATPPNDGGKSDKNDAKDSSRQAWKVKFRKRIAIPVCGAPAEGGEDPCTSLTGLSGARGPTSVTGRVNHKHVDGLYRELDRTVKCRLAKRTSARKRLEATLTVHYDPESQTFAVGAGSPLVTTLSLFPTACPKQGDSIDRIFDFYATPGFSFADSYGPDRWFTSGAVTIPVAVFHRSSRIRIPLADTKAGRPPRRCAVLNPSYERCKTGGNWTGVLEFQLAR